MLPIWMDSWSFPDGRSARSYEAWQIAPAVRPLKDDVVGNVGIVAGLAILELIVRLGPLSLPRVDEISLDARALAVALSISVLSGLVVGLVPTLKGSWSRTASALPSGGRTVGHARERQRAQSVVVVAQVALALVLLVAAGLMMRTFQALRTVDPGFTHAETLQTVRITIPRQLVPDPQRLAQVQHDIVNAVAAVPGVESAALASAMPLEMRGNNWDGITVEGRTPPSQDGGVRAMRVFKHVSPNLFSTAGTRLLAGRDFTWTDVLELRPVAIVSENLARELWGGAADALGARIRIGGPDTPWREVIGVVQDAHENGVQQNAPATVYWPPILSSFTREGEWFSQRGLTIVARSPLAGTQALAEQIQRAVWSVNASLPVGQVRTMQEVYDASLARTSFTLVMLAVASGIAFVLGLVGLYGVLSYAVSQRRREVAVRLALGAQQGALQRAFVGHGLALAGIGVIVGLGAAALVTRLMSSLLYEVRPLDGPTYGAVAALLAVAAALASYLPARRASRVPPAEALAAS